MRNLLEEFSEDHGVRRPTILGVREHIFTGRSDKFYSVYSEHCVMLKFLCYLNLSLALQCFFLGLVYVKSRNKLCHNWSKSSCTTPQVSRPHPKLKQQFTLKEKCMHNI